MQTAIRVLHVDTDSEFLALSTELLEDESTQILVETAQSVERACERLAAGDIDCIVSEFELQGSDGIEFLGTARSMAPNIPFILFTGMGSEAIASDAISAGVTDYLKKTGEVEQFTILANRIIKAVEATVARDRVQRREREYRTLVDSAPVSIVVLDSEAAFLYVNSSAASVLGIEQTESLLGDSAWEFLHHEDREESKQRLKHVLRSREPVEPREYRIVDVHGEVHHVHGNIVPVTFDGKAAAQLVFIDITERKQRAQTLERYRTAVEASGDGIYALDARGITQMVNERHLEFFGHSRSEVIGSHASVVANEESLEKGQAAIRTLLREEDREFASYEFEQMRDSEPRTYENTVSLIRDEDGSFSGSVGIVRDITERKQTERELKRQNERLDKFASVVSHDLKNPLNVAELRLDMAMGDHDSEDLRKVAQAHDRMETLVENVLRLAREGETVDDPGAVDIQSVAKTCWRTTETESARLVTDSTGRIRADESRLRALFENLFRNAVEHTEQSAVEITVGARDGTGFYVEDDGPGIPAEIRDYIFEFGSSSDADGTGFGLAIVREIVEAHDWHIAARESDEGGARFEISGVEFVD